MIKLYDKLPEIYFTESRDFQAIARSFEVIYNYIKTNADNVGHLCFDDNFDTQLLNLLTITLGFISKHNYNTRDLFNLCSSFANILKNKGSLKAVEETIKVLLNAQEIDKYFFVDIDKEDRRNLLIYLPYELEDIVLLEDVFDYILPSGFTYSIRSIEKMSGDIPTTLIGSSSVNSSQEYGAENLGQVANYNENTDIFKYNNSSENLSQASTAVVVNYTSTEEEQ